MSPSFDEAEEWHRVAEERRLQLERLQDQALYRTAAKALGQGRRAAHLVRRVSEPVRRAAVLVGRSAVAAPARVRARSRLDALRSAVTELPAPSLGDAGRDDVTAVIVTAAQPRRLDALLVALGRIGVGAIVVDNAGVPGTAQVVTRHAHARRIRLDAPLNYAAANERAIAEVSTTWTLLLNDDVAPLDDHWLDRMLVAADDATVAVGAQLVHGPRGLLGGEAVDGLVQHVGVGFVLDGPTARAVHLGRGSEPDLRDDVRTVPAATAACLLVRTEAHRAVGGFHVGFDYGSEDVDLCLRLAPHGAVRVALGAALLHEEGATRLVDRSGVDRRVRAARRRANHALLDARHGPLLRRKLVAAVLGDRASSGDGTGLVIGVAGPRPRLLGEVSLPPAVGIGTSPGALTVVTDPRRLPPEGRSAEVPLVGWVDDAHPLSQWSTEQLERLDALLVVDGAVAGVELPGHPTLPLHPIDDEHRLLDVLRGVLLAPRWTLRIGAPTARASDRGSARWGDPAIGDALARELRAHGLVVRVVGRDRWGEGADRAADVTVQLKGRGVAPTADAQVNVVWVISHPSEVAPGELEAVDVVVVASELLAERYRARTSRSVAVLAQATDARRFGPGAVDASLASRVLFVGNTRSVPRPVVLGAVDAGLPLTLVGGGWERYLDPRLVRRDHVPYADLPAWYRSAEIVLNDHWDDMARWGLVSNRVFDALACGACVVSDEVPGMAELLDDAVVTVRDAADVGPTVRALLDDPDARAVRAERGRRVVLAAHTWEHRAAELVRLVGSTTSGRGGSA
jgi:GT2 family glycosyltransferase/glycosyltransferase involved in cell wall biosynthesis